MIFEKQKLLVALKQCSAGIGDEAEENTFVFLNGKIYSSNGKVAISKKIDFCNDEISNFAVNANDFVKIVEKFKSDEIQVEITDNSLNMKCERSRVKLPFINFDYEKKYQNFENITDWEEIDENLVNGIIMCRILNNKSSLNGVFASGYYIYSTDGYQINKYRINLPTRDFYIDDDAAKEIIKFNNFKNITVGNWVHLKNEEDTVFSFRIMETEKYPVDKINELFNIEIGEKYTLPVELIEVIDRASVFGFDINSRNIIKLKFYENKIEVSSEKSTGSFAEEIELNYKFNFEHPVSVMMDKDMLIFALKNNMSFSILSDKIYLTTEYSEHIMSTFEE